MAYVNSRAIQATYKIHSLLCRCVTGHRIKGEQIHRRHNSIHCATVAHNCYASVRHNNDRRTMRYLTHEGVSVHMVCGGTKHTERYHSRLAPLLASAYMDRTPARWRLVHGRKKKLWEYPVHAKPQTPKPGQVPLRSGGLLPLPWGRGYRKCGGRGRHVVG